MCRRGLPFAAAVLAQEIAEYERAIERAGTGAVIGAASGCGLAVLASLSSLLWMVMVAGLGLAGFLIAYALVMHGRENDAYGACVEWRAAVLFLKASPADYLQQEIKGLGMKPAFAGISAVGREMAIVSHFDDATAWLRDNWPRVSTLARTEHEQE